MMKKTMIFTCALACIALAAPAVQAAGGITALSLQSGSQSGGQSGGSFPRIEQRDPAVEAHNRGKSLVSKKIACKKCAYPKGVKDAATARTVADKVRSGDFSLTKSERELVLFYLKNRFQV
jgi:hypothetical protein